jgi:hypothetical protein
LTCETSSAATAPQTESSKRPRITLCIGDALRQQPRDKERHGLPN